MAKTFEYSRERELAKQNKKKKQERIQLLVALATIGVLVVGYIIQHVL